jgi:Domain of unknown function (DUF4365)
MPGDSFHRKPKTLSSQGLLGQKGINFIERVVLEMGSRWTPSGPNEVGIDGYIELFDPSSNVALAKTLAVQSKVISEFANETEEAFDFWCSRRDLDYWLQGNMPIILIVSRPALSEAYWVSVKDYFATLDRRSSTKIRFSKITERFTSESFRDLVNLGRSPETGLYLAPVPRRERLYSNLLPLIQFPSKIYIASTSYRTPGEVWARLRRTEQNLDGAWILREKNVLAFHDLYEAPWSDICEPGTIDEFESSEWSDSHDADRERQFVQLLNRTLRSQVAPDVRYWPKEDCYACVGYLDEGKKRRSYESLKRRSPISVISKFQRTISDGRTFEWLRHLAFRGQFRRFDSQWYLEITPTYRYTRDGYSLYRFHEDALKGIKRIEGNRAVLSAVLFWADYLRLKDDFFAKKDLPLVFGKLPVFDLDVGINDGQWRKRDPNPPRDKTSGSQESFLPILGRQ